MVLQDFSTYTELDPNSRITITNSKVSRAGLSRGETAYVYKDFGVDYFNGSFEQRFNIQLTSYNAGGLTVFWQMTSDVNNFKWLSDNTKSNLALYTFGNALRLYERDGANEYNDSYTITTGTNYYVSIVRDESTGTYGTLYAYIYSNSARTTLLDTLSLTLHSSKKDFRYLYACNTYNDAEAGDTTTGFTENLIIGNYPRLTLGEYLGAGSGTTKLLLHLNGSSSDSSGNGNNGTDTAITYVDGKFGKCASFNGSTSKIALPATTSVKGLTQATFVAWFKKTGNPASQDIVYYESTNDGAGYSRLNFLINTDGSSLCVWRDTEKGTAYDTSMGSFGNNSWYNVISVFDSVGDTIKNYVNGALVSTTSGTIGAIPNTAPNKEIRITTNNSGLTWDENFIEAGAWTPQQVAKYYANAKGRYATL